MTGGTYAAKTDVPVSRSRDEIERTLTIPLTRGQSAVIDEEDEDLVRGRRWWAAWRDGRWYAVAGGDRRGELVYMHRLLTNAPKGTKVDHADHNGLNNRRRNLRVCSNAENMRNRDSPNANSTTGLIGVYFDPRYRLPYIAKIKTDGKSAYVGRFATAEEAGRARDAAARVAHGDFAYLNFPDTLSATHKEQEDGSETD